MTDGGAGSARTRRGRRAGVSQPCAGTMQPLPLQPPQPAGSSPDRSSTEADVKGKGHGGQSLNESGEKLKKK